MFGTDQDNGPRPTPDSVGGLYGFDWRSSQWYGIAHCWVQIKDNNPSLLCLAPLERCGVALRDNGMDPAAALEHSLDVREIALSTLDERTLQPYDCIVLHMR